MKGMGILICLVHLSLFVNSQNSIKVLVKAGESKAPLGGASVTLPALGRGAVTDSSGHAVLYNLPNGFFL